MNPSTNSAIAFGTGTAKQATFLPDVATPVYLDFYQVRWELDGDVPTYFVYWEYHLEGSEPHSASADSGAITDVGGVAAVLTDWAIAHTYAWRPV